MSQNLCSTNLIGLKKIGLKQHSITVNKNCFSPKGESNWVTVSVVTFSPMTNFSADLMLNHRRYVRSTDRRTNNRVVKAVSIVPSSHARCRHTWRNLKKVTRAILDYFLLCVKKNILFLSEDRLNIVRLNTLRQFLSNFYLILSKHERMYIGDLLII